MSCSCPESITPLAAVQFGETGAVHRDELLDQSLHLWLSANRPDGPPHTTPVWFVHDQGTLWLSITTGSRKASLLRTDPRVSAAIAGTEPDGGLVGQGTAELVDVGARPDVVAALTAKYGWDAADPATDGARVLVRVTVDRWLLEPS